MNCDKCGGFLRKEKDYVYDVDYLICGMCGKVFYNNEDGLGVLRFRLASTEKTYEIICKKCKKPFKSNSPNKKKCIECDGGNK
jgi:DNA-directed RNA polymerase subunit M/transcription elongation factor TFIIS